MALSLNDAKSTLNAAVAGGLAVIDPMLQGLYDEQSTDVALLTALTNLRTQYALDQMRINRAQITAIDGDPTTIAILDQLSSACDTLNSIQVRSAAATAWVNHVTGGLDNAMAAYSGLTKLAAAI
jgi:hypothetical protein